MRITIAGTVGLTFFSLALITLALSASRGHANEDNAEHDAEHSAILRLIGPRSGETICDLGCGRGTWTFKLARAVGKSGTVYAVDIDARILQDVRKQRDEGKDGKYDNVQDRPVVGGRPDAPRQHDGRCVSQ